MAPQAPSDPASQTPPGAAGTGIGTAAASRTGPAERAALRRRLIADRQAFVAGPAAGAAHAALAARLREVLQALEPGCLGVYWATRGEFNARALWDPATAPPWPLALPYARRVPHEMHFRRWDGAEPAARDECGLPAADGAPVVPDVVLVPCVGYTRSGLRLGYGGGYFDRWLDAHAHVTAVGVAWSLGELDDAEFAAEAHDRPLALVVTERGVHG